MTANTQEKPPNELSTTEVTNPTNKKEPTLVEHLTDLRKQLIKSTVVFLVFFFGVFSTINQWFPYVTKGHKLIVLSPLEIITFYMSISAAIAFGLALPFVCHFLWQFVKPGLNEKESRFLSLYSPFMFILFAGGLVFGYYVVNPLSYNFLISLGAMNFDVMISAQEYARFLLLTTMPIGLLFELPMVTLFLAAIGLLTGETMKKVRKWSYIVLAVVSGLITPPDFISQLIVLVPMILLYEGSIQLVIYTEKRARTKESEKSQSAI
ncbi:MULTISPECIES: twin-arginine translocase subunit TatC [unclassified Sporosarcina]|uniref:twin-arginine translocase subunit TatC n=1 Tax=unclassified Sporosarcina TaxID=2647733 RepID=UPI00204127A3|nr:MULTISPECIES: twin-arginine translocase subunit TatC [unclassified Sporosarcina]GKV65327.1 Sec-independent protein translocase protein TatC [Sporosarcina sp. NCCP-2331]GLB55451.1 Sec-independent protein translocase protein TatC [Sporosarcina sp. NCCP-2378]